MKHLHHSILFLLMFVQGIISATTNHTITIGDATNDFDNGTENLGTESSRTGHLTWDATNLYIGVTGNPIVATGSNFYVVIDLDPATNSDSRSGAGRSDQPTGESGGATYPFNADIVYLFYGTGSNDGSIQNPASGLKYTVSGGNWVSASIASGVRTRRHNTDISDFEIPFSDLGVSSDAVFNVIFYIANNTVGGNNFAQWPTNNSNGNAQTLTHYYTFKRTTGVSPVSLSNFSLRLTGGGFSFSETSLANATLLGSSQTYNCGALTSISQNLFIGSTNTFTMNSNAAALNVTGNMTNNGTLTLSSNVGGDMGIAGHFTQNGTFNCSERALAFQGSSQQTISGTNATTIDYMTVNNTAGVALSREVTVDNQLTLTNGIVSLGSNNLVINATGSITGSFGATRMIAADGSGSLRRNISADGSYLFPVGDNTGTAEYSPVNVNNLDGSSFSGAYVQVNVDDMTHPNNGSATDFLSRYWTVEASGFTVNTYDIVLNYQQADVNGTESAIVLGKRTGGIWSEVGTIDATNNRFSATGLTSFSEFTGGEPAAFPVELVHFDASPDARCVKLKWLTASEQDNSHFDIERSADGRTWQALGSVMGAGNSIETRQYAFMDEKPLPLNFYRLKQVDYSGRHEYSKVVSVAFGEGATVRILPNPATYELQVLGMSEGASALIFDQNGRLVRQANTAIIVIEDLVPGVYFVKVLGEAGQSLHVERFVKH